MDEIFRLTRPDPVTGRLERLPASQRVAALLEHPRSAALIRALDPQALYSLITQAGLEDAHELLLVAAPAQVQAIIDFDCWTRDVVEPARLTAWLELLLQRDDARFEELIHAIDLEPIVVWLRTHCQVFTWEEDTDLLDELDVAVCSSPDGVYAIAIPEEESVGNHVRLLLERVYAVDLTLGHRLIEATRWETTSELTETAFRHREARLGDLGIVPVHEAVEVYAPIDPAQWAAQARAAAFCARPTVITLSTAGTLPPLDDVLQQIEVELGRDDAPLVARAIAALAAAFSGPTLEHIVDSVFSQLRAVVTRVHVADVGHPGDAVGLRAAITRALDHLSLGLELASGGDAVRAAQVLATAPLRDIHRAGFGLLARLATQAKALARRGNLTLIDGKASLLDPADADLIEGLAARRPMMSRLHESRFRTLVDVESVARRLQEVAFAELLTFSTLRHTRPELAELVFDRSRCATPVECVSFRLLFATHLVSAVVDGRRGLVPLTLAEVHSALAQLGAPQAAHSTLTSLGVRLACGDAAGGALGPMATAYSARIAGWILDELGHGAPPQEIAAQVVLLTPP